MTKPKHSTRSTERREVRSLIRGFEPLEARVCRASDLNAYAPTWCFPAEGESVAVGEPESPPPPPPVVDSSVGVLTDGEVETLLRRATAASASNDAVIAVVDRNGRILGVRAESDVLAAYGADIHKLVFAIDGAVAEARTAALFANDQAPLTSRTIRNLSQSTVTQREVEGNPTLPDPSNTLNNNPFDPTQPISKTFGPGFVAPVGIGGHFPPGIKNTPPVDLFGIERQSRDSLIQPGLDGVKGVDDIVLPGRFNIDPTLLTPGDSLFAPESYGLVSGQLPYAQARGLGTMPGGIPIYKVVDGNALPTMVGGIGVFFPGPDGYATYEQNFQHASSRPSGQPQSDDERLNAPRALEAEWMAFAAVGGIHFFNPTTKYGNGSIGSLNGVAALPNFGLPYGRIDLVGITLEVFGPNPSATRPRTGLETVLLTGQQVGRGDPDNGADQMIDPLAPNPYLLYGEKPPEGWILPPRLSPDGSSELTIADMEQIVADGIAEANRTRAAIRLDLINTKNGLPQPGVATKMVFAIGDRSGNILALYRMPDATMFSIDVAVAKARNTAYYANPGLLQDEDKIDDDLLLAYGVATASQLKSAGAPIDGTNNGNPDLYLDSGSKTRDSAVEGNALSNRTFRFLAAPHYPAGVDGSMPPIFSSLNTLGVNHETAENSSANPLLAPPASNFVTVLGFDAFHVDRNFRNPTELANQNGVVFFPGSTPLYVGAMLTGGLGISGDGVDQDDVVTYAAEGDFAPPTALQADQLFYRGVRLPFLKFNRNPMLG